MNFVEGGTCHVTGKECLLGTIEVAKRCELQGGFDVWVTQDDEILLSDIGPPSPEPKRSIALGVQKQLANVIAQRAACTIGSPVITTQKECRECGKKYWLSDHESSREERRIGRRYFCPNCIGTVSSPSYWCG
jgi:ribosomal protein S27AE